MVKLLEAVEDIALDKPGRPGHDPDPHLTERGVAASPATVTVGVLRKLRLVVGLQQQA